MSVKLNLMETRVTFRSRSSFLASSKSLAAQIRECFERYYKNAPFNTGTSNLTKHTHAAWKTDWLSSEKTPQEFLSAGTLQQNQQQKPSDSTALFTAEIPAPNADIGLSPSHPGTPEKANVSLKIPRRKFALKKSVLFLPVMGVAMFFVATLLKHPSVEPKTSLPYAHAIGPVLNGKNLYIADWFRSNLYAHKMEKGLPMVSVGSIPNQLITGLAMTPGHLWTIDGVNNRILQHTLTPEHLVVHSFPSPAKRPRGLFYDGNDLWSGDEMGRTIFRHQGTNPTTIKDTFGFTDASLTSFHVAGERLWILDRSARKIIQFKLKKPLLPETIFDLTSLLGGSEPRGFSMEGKNFLVATENPVALLRISPDDLR